MSGVVTYREIMFENHKHQHQHKHQPQITEIVGRVDGEDSFLTYQNNEM